FKLNEAILGEPVAKDHRRRLEESAVDPNQVLPAKLLFRVFRLRPYDTATPEGRSLERYRRLAVTAISSAAGRGVSVAVGFVTVPLTLGYLGSERYGMWVTISSVVALLMLADFGINNGLLNLVAEAHGRDNQEAARQYVSSAIVVLSAVALGLGA